MPLRKSLLPDIVTIAGEAGKAIMVHYHSLPALATVYKPDQSPVTRADLEANEMIVMRLRALNLAIPCVSEEGDIPDYNVRKSWRHFWLVDPLDGTKEFLKGTKDFTVNIALIEGDEPVLGVVFVPAMEVFYYAEKGKGSWKQAGGRSPERIYSSSASPKGGVVVVESRSHPSSELEPFLGKLKVRERIRIGSSLKFCMVADGSADIYPRFGPTMEWDTAAGDCVYRNSGREGLHASPLIYNKPSFRNGNFVIDPIGLLRREVTTRSNRRPP